MPGDDRPAEPAPAAIAVAVLLTRAEEEGFIGCIAACEHRTSWPLLDFVVFFRLTSWLPLGHRLHWENGDPPAVDYSGGGGGTSGSNC